MRAVLAAGVVGLLASAAAATPVANQVNTFQGGANAGWTNGGAATDPTVFSTGGPAGAADGYLRVTATGGGGPGSHLVAFNVASQWTGNFSTAGVNAISMDLKNFSTSPLSMRISLQETGSTWYVSNPAVSLPADSAWHAVTFPLTPTGMTATNGATPLSIGLTRIQEIRILDNPSTDYRGAVISASFGMDNVRAVPEPAGALLLGILVPLLSRRSTRSRRAFPRTRGFSNHG